MVDLIYVHGVDSHQLRMKVFPLSLADDAQQWWINDGEGKITVCEELVEKNFCKFYPESYDGEEEMLDEGVNWAIDPLEFISRVNSSFDKHMKNPLPPILLYIPTLDIFEVESGACRNVVYPDITYSIKEIQRIRAVLTKTTKKPSIIRRIQRRPIHRKRIEDILCEDFWKISKHVPTPKNLQYPTLRKFYENVGSSHQTSVACTPQQNGIVERGNLTLVEAARTMLVFSKAPLFLWAEAINTACYTQNRSLIRLRYNKTPYELMQDKKLDLSFFHVFGLLCYPTNDNDDLGKLDAIFSLVTRPQRKRSESTTKELRKL
ncbi:retrovirus-related pol polyprotein from transposon TNT 1-94 [Tanacetum coccineum]